MTASTDLEDLLFGPNIAARPCGDCVACCVITNIEAPELVKPEGLVCPHCTGQGCGIYETRPQVCRTYNCGYKRVPALPPQTRPDLMGVMFTLERHLPPRNLFEHLYYVGCAVKDPRALDSPLTADVLAMLAQGVLPVFVSWNGVKTLVHPAPDLADAIVNPAPQADRALVRRGREWLARYAPFARLGGGDHTKLPAGF